MHESHGADVSNLDDASSHYGLGHSYRNRPQKLRAGEMPENNMVATDAKGRRVVTLRDTEGDCDTAFYGKAPHEIAAELDARARAEEDNASTDAIMRDYPGKPVDGVPHGSSSGKRHAKPNPPPDFVNAGGRGGKEDPEKYRVHQVGGRVSTAAKRALEAQKARGASIGDMMNLVGETMASGVTWTQIEWALQDLARTKRVA